MEYFAIQHADGGRRNEFRAVYGGFSIAISGMLVLAILDVALRPGIVFTVVAVVFGMALGRVISFAIDGYFERYAVAFFVLELLLGGALLLLNF